MFKKPPCGTSGKEWQTTGLPGRVSIPEGCVSAAFGSQFTTDFHGIIALFMKILPDRPRL